MKTVLYCVKSLFIPLAVMINCTLPTQAQDVQFSQFYAVSPYQNPAFIGGAHALRAMVHSRVQWPGLDANYTTYLASVDNFAHKANSGYGLMITHDRQGSNTISTTSIDLQYAYEIPVTADFTIRAGLHGGMVQRFLNYSSIVLPSQIDPSTGDPIGPGNFGNKQRYYVDISSGLLAYSSRFWGGISAHHLNQPNQTFISGQSRLPYKVAITTGMKFPIRSGKQMAYLHEGDRIVLTPCLHYKLQGKNDQLDLGAYLLYDQLLLGLWYRGIPVKHYKPKISNNESMVLSTGWKYNEWTFGYSFDFVISKLGIGRTFGAHEINVTYIYDKKSHSHKPMKRLPCPDFYRH